MIDPRLDDALEAATEKARLFTSDTLAGEYVNGWRQAIEALVEWGTCLCGKGVTASDCQKCKAITEFCDAMVPTSRE